MRIALVVLFATLAVTLIADFAAAEGEDNEQTISASAKWGAGIALAGCGIGTGLGQGQIGAAAVGMIAEDSSKFGTGLLFTVLPETVVLFGFLAMFLL